LEEYNNKKIAKILGKRQRDLDTHREKLLRRNKNIVSFHPALYFSPFISSVSFLKQRTNDISLQRKGSFSCMAYYSHSAENYL
jgi:hypothetical protein